jgi:hypothetical protein
MDSGLRPEAHPGMTNYRRLPSRTRRLRFSPKFEHEHAACGIVAASRFSRQQTGKGEF